MTQTNTILISPRKEKQALTQKIFKYINLVLLGFLIYCIPGFLSFRQLAHQKNYYFVSNYSWLWSAIGFAVYGTIKYIYFALAKQHILNIIHPKYQGDQRLYRLKSVCKLTFDACFYAFSSLFGFLLFRKQYWFPKMIGGCGQCEQIFQAYPNWPSPQITPALECFYLVQLGVHIFSIFESIIIKRTTDRKYYQFLLHHFIASTLILFSLLTNMVAVGAVILVVHDFSDCIAAFSRAMLQTKFESVILDTILFLATTINWFYMRLFVFPYCLIRQIYESIPNAENSWWSLRVEHSYIALLCSTLAFMHLFWFFFMVQYAVERITGKGKRNTHDKTKQ